MSSNKSKTESVRVIGRFRPPNKREKAEWNKYSDSKWQNETEIPVSASGSNIKIENPTSGRPYRFAFDDVLWWKSTQEEVFEKVAAPCCRSALNGFNGTIFAYGQTGSGKTHTVVGPEGKFSVEDSGIVPRAANFFFHAIENSPDIDSAELKVCFMEVYKGHLRDLNPSKKAYPELKIRQKMNSETYVENLNETTVTSLGQILKLIAVANSHRTMAATSMNKTSSRSHLIITFLLKIRKTPEAGGHKLTSKVNFIDLAGSEKVKKTGASGIRLSEAKSINLGLSTLARVIESLAKQRKSIPFRDSALTWILKDSLAGNTKTTLIVTCSPHQFNKEESVSTCRFASRCKLIKTVVNMNKELTPQQMKSLIKKLRIENLELRDQVELGGGYDPDQIQDDDKDEIIQNYKRKVERLEGDIKSMKKENKKNDENYGGDNAFDDERHEFEQTIKNLETEIDGLKGQLEVSAAEKRSLAVMNAILGERLDDTTQDIQNEQAITDLAKNNIQYLQADKSRLLEELKDLRFASDEAQQIYDSTFQEMIEISEQLEDTNKDLDDLEDKLELSEQELEKRNYEISKLQNQLEMSNKKRNMDQGYDDDDDESKFGGGGANVVATSFTLKSGVDLEDQENYLQDLADKEQEIWEEREEKAWRKYLNVRAKDEGYKKGKDLLKARRAEAKRELKNGVIDEMPEDEELLEDIRDDFYRLYDPATGQIRDDDDDEDRKDQDYLDEIDDENAIDDPLEWGEEEVAHWLKDIGLKKYSKTFKKEGIDGRVLLVDLNKTNLKRDLGVKSVHVDKLMRGIQELRQRSPGYDEWKVSQGIVDEPVKLNRVNIDDEFDVDVDVDGDDDFELTEEEKQFGEQFWALDELFNILDIHGTAQLDRSAFKHGLHALKVELNDEEMDNVFQQIVNDDDSGMINYKAFIQYLQFTDFLGPQSQKYAMDILAALPRVAANRRQYVTRAAMVIKYAIRYNNTKTEINNYLQNKGLQRAEIDAAWKQYRFNPKAIRDIDFKSLIGRKGKLIDMAIKDPENVRPFDDFALYKLLKRAGFKAFGSKEFNDLDYLRASGSGSKISCITCWYDPQSAFFNGLQITYECNNGEQIKGGRNMVRQGQYIEDEMKFQDKELLISVTVYFAHFVCGIMFVTDKRERLMGTDHARQSVTLSAPIGTCIMAFYGSIGRLVETIGCYVCVNSRAGGGKGNKRNQPIQSGVRQMKKGKKKMKSNNSMRNQPIDTEEEGDITTTKNKGKNKRNKKDKFQTNDDYDDY